MKIETVTRYQDFIRLRMDWNCLVRESENPSVFLTHEWYSAWWEGFAERRRLNIILVREENGILTGIAPFFHENGRIQFMAGREVTDYCDFIVKKGRTQEFLHAVFSALRRDRKTKKNITLINIPDSSPTLSCLEEAAARNDFVCEGNRWEAAPVLGLPPCFQDYLNSLRRKDRHEMKRKARRMEKNPHVRIEYLTGPSRIISALPEFIRLHKNGGEDKKAFWEKRGITHFFENLAFQLSRRGMAELNMLYMEDVLIGALFNLLYKDTVYFYNVAYHPEYSRYSPGIYLFFSRIKKAIENRKREVDFLRGQEKYKYAFGAKDRLLYQVKLTLKENPE